MAENRRGLAAAQPSIRTAESVKENQPSKSPSTGRPHARPFAALLRAASPRNDPRLHATQTRLQILTVRLSASYFTSLNFIICKMETKHDLGKIKGFMDSSTPWKGHLTWDQATAAEPLVPTFAPRRMDPQTKD